MKTTAISGDLLLKIALGAVVLLGVAWAVKKAGSAVSDTVGPYVQSINPMNQNNVINQTVATWGGKLVTAPDGPGKNADGSWTLGAWIYDVTH